MNGKYDTIKNFPDSTELKVDKQQNIDMDKHTNITQLVKTFS